MAANNFNISQTSVIRIAKENRLKPYHSRRTSKVTDRHMIERVRFARFMLRHFGHNPYLATGIRLTKVINSDFSKKFVLRPFPNTKNQVVWSESRLDADNFGGLVGVEKYSPGAMLWGAISWRGLIPHNAPVFVDDFLRDNFQFVRGEKKTVDGNRYIILLRNIASQAVFRLYPEGDAIWQDDGATIHRTAAVLDEVRNLFRERIPSEIQCAKFDDCWPIENVWGIIKERIGHQELKTRICEIWRGVSRRTCRALIMSLPKRCRKVIVMEGRRLTRDDYRKEE